MKKIKIISLILITGLAIIACKPSKDKSIAKINQLEKELLSTTAQIDSTKAQQLIDLYVGYADQYKTDSLAPIYLFKASDISMNISRYELSIGLLDRIRADYPDFSKIPDCLFLKAFIYENMTNELKKAEDAYKEFISKYPEDELVSSAKAAIEHLGIPTEDLIKSFEEKNKSAKDSIKA
jgi:outer membrane protein assembly factor BamD (BamD/ComL family)